MTLPTSASLKFGAIACASAAVIGLVWWRQTLRSFAGSRATDADHAAIQAAATAAQRSLAQVSASNLIENPDALTRKDVEILEFLTRQSPLVLFIKGDASKQRCKFSRRLIELLPSLLGQPLSLAASAEAVRNSESMASAPTAEWLAARGIVCVDILADSSLRTGLKSFAEWPSYPMVWLHGKLIGGVDVCEEMVSAGQTLDLKNK